MEHSLLHQCCKTVLFQFFSFFFPFRRIKTNLNNSEGSHAFHTYTPHFYSSNNLLNIRERVFFRLVEDSTVPVPSIQTISRRAKVVSRRADFSTLSAKFFSLEDLSCNRNWVFQPPQLRWSLYSLLRLLKGVNCTSL